MKEWSETLKSVGKYSVAYILLIFAYIQTEKMQWLDNVSVIQLLIQILIAIAAGYYLLSIVQIDKMPYSNKTEWNYEKLCTFILIAGIIMRVGYTLYTPWYERVHDIGNATLEDAGHASYILHL